MIAKFKKNTLVFLSVISCFNVLLLSGCQTSTGIQMIEQPSSQIPVSQQETPKKNPYIHPKPSEITHNRLPVQQPPTTSTSTSDSPVANDKAAPAIIHKPTSVTPSVSTPTTSNPTAMASKNEPDYPHKRPKPNAHSPSPTKVVKKPTPAVFTPPNTKTTQQILLDKARQHSRIKQTPKKIQNGDRIPAFRQLMSTGIHHLRQGNIALAHSTFTQAQRLAPQSSAVYFYLGQVALRQNKPLTAEAMARRGLVVAQSAERKKALWQVVLKSAIQQDNQSIIKEAKAKLSHLPK